MRELEFLPAWYPQLQRRRRMVFIQAWLMVALACSLALWVYLADRNERGAEETLMYLHGQLAQAESQLVQMDRLEVLRKQWVKQDETLNHLGLHVKAAHLIGKVATVLPGNVSLLGLAMEVEETPVHMTNVERAGSAATPGVPRMDRRLKVRLQGVAPTDVELALLLTELNKVPFFDQVTPTYAQDRRDSGHIQREFELTFSVNLNVPSSTGMASAR
jgi:Tfp pilus assembly protein PilN